MPVDDPVLRRVAAVRPAVPDEDLSPDGPRAQAILHRVLDAHPTPARRRRPRWTRPRRPLPWLGLAIAPGLAAAAVVLLLAGTFAGPDRTGTQSANAAVIRDTIDALRKVPGTIVVEDDTYLSGPGVDGHPYTTRLVLESPAGTAPQSLLSTTTQRGGLAPGHRPVLGGSSITGGTEAFYSPETDTVYSTSIWGPYLHPGRRPGTYVYRPGPGSPTSAGAVTITAAERRGLLRGTLAIQYLSPTSGPRVLPPERAPSSLAQVFRSELAHHLLHVAGRVNVAGRRAIELAGTTNGQRSGDAIVDIGARSHLPFRVVDQPGTRRRQVIAIRLRSFPITAPSRRLLSLAALHPGARVDRSHADYVRIAGGVSNYDQ